MSIEKETMIHNVMIDSQGNMTVNYQHTFIEDGETVGNGNARETFTLDSDMSGEDPYLVSLMSVVRAEYGEE